MLGALDAPENVLDNASDAANGCHYGTKHYRSSLKTMSPCGRTQSVSFYRQGFVSPSKLDTNIDAALKGNRNERPRTTRTGGAGGEVQGSMKKFQSERDSIVDPLPQPCLLGGCRLEFSPMTVMRCGWL